MDTTVQTPAVQVLSGGHARPHCRARRAMRQQVGAMRASRLGALGATGSGKEPSRLTHAAAVARVGLKACAQYRSSGAGGALVGRGCRGRSGRWQAGLLHSVPLPGGAPAGGTASMATASLTDLHHTRRRRWCKRIQWGRRYHTAAGRGGGWELRCGAHGASSGCGLAWACTCGVGLQGSWAASSWASRALRNRRAPPSHRRSCCWSKC